MSLKNKKIIIGLSGGIAAYKVPYLIRSLIKNGADVRAIMTNSALKFITPLTIETVSQNPVACDMFPDRYVATHHIDMARWADLIVVAPATANIIGKVASGVCDDLLSTVICAAQSPVLFAPAMNTEMYLNPVTQKNIKFLKSIGYMFAGPGEGELACETTGVGRMLEPEEIHTFISDFFRKKKALKNKKVLVTAGPCREAIDPVRYISNRSSGKMGYALAGAAAGAGADVTLISGPANLKADGRINLVNVETTEQMFKAVKKYFRQTDFLIMAAAPADFKAKKPASQKIKKESQKNERLVLELSPTVDILSSLIKIKKQSQKIIGFALETENGIKNAMAKLKAKKLDLIVLNSMENSTPFESDLNKVILITKTGNKESIPEMDKRLLAERLIEKIAKLK